MKLTIIQDFKEYGIKKGKKVIVDRIRLDGCESGRMLRTNLVRKNSHGKMVRLWLDLFWFEEFANLFRKY